ncbi:PCP degradation transcriptional activation protein [compost metagenome]
MKLDLNLLRVLQAIYDTRNITAAAGSLKVSQPAASAALARLRDSFNDPLFIRTPFGMEPTPRTESIIEKVKEVIESIDQDILTRQCFDPRQASSDFVLCLTAIAEHVFLPSLFPVMKQQAPSARIRSLSLSPQDVAQGLQSGKVDLAIGFYPDLVSADIYQQRLFSHALVCLVRKGHPIAGSRMTLDEFLKAEHVQVKDSSRTSEMFDQVLATCEQERNVVLTTSHYMSVPGIICESDLVAVAPKVVANMFAEQCGLKIVSLPVEIPEYDVKQYWHRKFHHHPRLIWLRSLIQREFSNAPAASAMSKFA